MRQQVWIVYRLAVDADACKVLVAKPAGWGEWDAARREVWARERLVAWRAQFGGGFVEFVTWRDAGR
jgi:hypothetical protein